MTAVLDTDHVAFVTDSPGSAVDGRVRVLELQPPHFVPLHALWAQHTTSESRDAFLDAVVR